MAGVLMEREIGNRLEYRKTPSEEEDGDLYKTREGPRAALRRKQPGQPLYFGPLTPHPEL